MIERLINTSDHNGLGVVVGGWLGEAVSFKVVRDRENQPGRTLQTPIQGVVCVGLVMILSEPYYGYVDVNLKGTHVEGCAATCGHCPAPCVT